MPIVTSDVSISTGTVRGRWETAWPYTAAFPLLPRRSDRVGSSLPNRPSPGRVSGMRTASDRLHRNRAALP
jgi:hypothetical protein